MVSAGDHCPWRRSRQMSPFWPTFGCQIFVVNFTSEVGRSTRRGSRREAWDTLPKYNDSNHENNSSKYTGVNHFAWSWCTQTQ